MKKTSKRKTEQHAKTLPRRWVNFFLAVENQLFPLIFLLSAVHALVNFLKPLDRPMLGKFHSYEVAGVVFGMLFHPDKIPHGTTYAQLFTLLGMSLVRPVLVVAFSTMLAVFIAFRSGLKYKPTTLSEVIIPTIGTFVMSLVPVSVNMGGRLGRPIVYPPGWNVAIYATSTTLFIIGGIFAIWGLSHLRRNLSVYVEVRKIVLSGPYRFVRHPIYTGEMVTATGVVLTLPNVANMFLLAALFVFQYLRARMEERRLRDASNEYEKLFQRTGMFFPRFWRRPAE